MRLSNSERLKITQSIIERDPDASIYLFGSRIDDSARGGDIDLLVLSEKIGLWDRLDILAYLHLQLGERKIDLIVYPDLTTPFARIAVDEGVRL